MVPIYYWDQQDWEKEDFYGLNRYLNKLFLQADTRMEEIKAIDLTKVSEITRVLMYVIVKFQHKDSLLDMLPNLTELKNVKPLEHRLDLVENPIDCHEVYMRHNIGL